MKQLIKFSLVVLFVSFVTGCATSRSVVDVDKVVVSTPKQGTDVKFSSVTDLRDFQVKPRSADTPSLKHGEIGNEDVTSRAIARKRNGFGMAMGDIVLPENTTVMEVIENQLSKIFNDNGYRVLLPEDRGYSEAIPLDVDILKLWGWMSPGFWSLGITFEAAVSVIGPHSQFHDGVMFESSVEKRYQTGMTSNWKKVLELSLQELREDADTKLKYSD